jgi:hypothetical protein
VLARFKEEYQAEFNCHVDSFVAFTSEAGQRTLLERFLQRTFSQMTKRRELTVPCDTKSGSLVEGKVTAGEEKSSFSIRRPSCELRLLSRREE